MYNGYKIIALCISKAGDERNFEFIESLNKAVTGCGYRLFVYHTCSDLYQKTRNEEGDRTVFKLIDFDIVDAVIIFDEAFQDKTPVDAVALSAASHGIPVISVGAIRNGCISFLFGYEKGFEQVVRHVIEYHGVKNTCFVAGVKNEHNSEQRISIYKRVLADNGISFRPDRLFYGDYWWGPTQTAVKSIIELDNIPQAIICANDTMAITVCRELKKYGYSVPEDILVTGFDGIESAVRCIPPITTCKCSLDHAAEKIMKVIREMFEGKTCEECYDIDYEISIYRSCGCSCDAPPFNMGDRLRSAEDRFIKYQEDECTLHEISERIIEANSPQAFSLYLDSFGFSNTCIILNNDCFDMEVNPTKNNRSCCFDDVMQVLFMSGSDLKRFPEPICRKNILPNMDYFISRKNPLIFSALSFLRIPMGFACFGFEMDINIYCRILQYVNSFNTTIGNYRLVRHLKFTAESVENISKQDFMTGLYNRKGFYNALPRLINSAAEDDIIAVATVDIDGLKNINDNFGHEDGDLAIITVSEAVKRLPFEHKICGRFGGDELVVCARTKLPDAEQILKDSIEKYLGEMNRISGKPFEISASTGVFTSGAKDFEFEYSLKQSDERMYIMKTNRPNRRKN